MDPATIVGLVASVIQIVQFTTDVVRESHRLVQSGKKPTSTELAQVVRCQEEACRQILADIEAGEAADFRRRSSSPLDDGDGYKHRPPLRLLAKSCVEEASKLTEMLKDLAVKPRDDGTVALGAALWSVTRGRLKKKEIEESQRKLKGDISTLLQHIISRDQKDGIVKTHDLIRSTSKEQEVAFNTAVNDARKKLEATSAAQAAEQARFLNELSTKVRNQYQTATIVVSEKDNSIIQKTDENQQKAKKEIKAFERILKSLDFSERTQRQVAISDAHHDTYAWMFDEDCSPIENWAESQRGIFWINGKAGSGKSTLMKYITGHTKTRGLLRKWAEGTSATTSTFLHQSPLTLVEIYFWFLGSDLQKSEEGLLKSILYQILRASRDLFPVAFPHRWKSVLKAIDSTDPWEIDLNLDAASVPWTNAELRQTLDRIAECTSESRFAIFIDGLDEYKADHTGLVKLIQKLAHNPDFKFCVSSRPWNIFIDAFGYQQDTFVLEDLTRDDIRKYVYSELASHTSDRPQLDVLCSEVVQKAQGVFLWVFLTVRSLLEGITEGDSVRILRRRVDMLPSDLEDYFDVMLSRVHKVYQGETATALHIVHKAAKADLVESVGYEQHDVTTKTSWRLPTGHSRTFLNLWLLQEGFETEDFALTQEIVDVTALECQKMVVQTKKFISARCKDLLCVPKPPAAIAGDDEVTYITQYRVDFLHRTVFEYLDSPNITARLQRSIDTIVSGGRFDAMLSLARLSIVPKDSAGRCRFLNETLEGFAELAPHNALDMAVYARLDCVAAHYLNLCPCDQRTFCEKHHSIRVLHMLVSRRQYLVATAVMLRNPKIAINDSIDGRRPLLSLALGPGVGPTSRLFPLDEIDNKFIAAYLAHNLPATDLNLVDLVTNLSVWDRFLSDWYGNAHSLLPPDAARVWNIAKLFIQAGIDISRGARGLEGHPSTIKILTDLIPAEHRYELHELIVSGGNNTSQRREYLAGRISVTVLPGQTRAGGAELTTVETKKPTLVKAPVEQTAEEIELYFQRTGFRP